MLLRNACLTVLLTTLVAVPGLAQVNQGMPDVGDMAYHFFSLYRLPDDQMSLIQFQKRPGGWYVGVGGPGQLFWDRTQQQYHSLDYAAADTAATRQNATTYLDQNVDDLSLYNFRRVLYYGYDGWDRDVIQAVENESQPTDSLLESLARAYSNYATKYVPDSGQISSSEIAQYVSYEQKAVQTYQRLLQLNRAFNTRVGNVELKLNNERMFAYSTLKAVGYEQQAGVFLSDMIFPDSLLQKADSILQYVRPNSILITSGDNTTYPIWYVQSKGVRTDVLAIDYSLLNQKRWVAYLDHQYHHSLFNADSSTYLSKGFDYAIFQSGQALGREQRLDSFLTALYLSPDKFFTKDIYLALDPQKAARFYQTPARSLSQKIHLPIKGYYLLISDILELDILDKNILIRRIYFTSPPENIRFDPYLVNYENSVWEFSPVIHKDPS